MLIGDSRSAALRHEIPLPFGDLIGFIEVGGLRYVIAGALAAPALSELPGLTVLSQEELGLPNLQAAGVPFPLGHYRTIATACEFLGVTQAKVPYDFPLALAEILTDEGITVLQDGAKIAFRRRVKSEAELKGIRRAEAAAESALYLLRDRLASGTEQTSEELRIHAWRTFAEHSCAPNPKLTIAAGMQSGNPHASGTGPIPMGVPIIIDAYPQDLMSGCWGDMTRTFCIGPAPAKLQAMHKLVCEVLHLVTQAVAPGVTGDELNDLACARFSQAGFATGRLASDGSALGEGFPHFLGHGLGLDLHEPPFLDFGGQALVAGDVITVEPGLYERGWGGVRIEDALLVTATGCEIISNFPYELSI